ncbi:methionine adenosyltransferase [Gemmatimonadota bacterium]
MKDTYILTSESVTEGHPDKVCDYISDSILDAHLEQDSNARVACDCLAKSDLIVVAGEITSKATVDYDAVVRAALREIDPDQPFYADTVEILLTLTEQAPEIAHGVGEVGAGDSEEQGAGDQGIMFGYASDETPELMPLPILLAHRLARGLAEDRKAGSVPWLRPDGKAQVAVEYQDGRPAHVIDYLVSTQHTADMTDRQDEIVEYVRHDLAPRVLGDWYRVDLSPHVNPTGSFEQGGPSADSGITGRKIMVDTYGGAARHGGGAFSGKDPSKVDRSAAYFARWAARQVVLQGIAHRAEIQVSYVIGEPGPMSLQVDTFGSGDQSAADEYVRSLDWRPGAIIEQLDLLRPIYRQTTNYGHFGRADLPWEASGP